MPNLFANLPQSLFLLGAGQIYPRDILDVIFAALLIYLILLLLKQTRSFLILFGVSLLGGMFILSRLLNLYLTTIALQTVFNFLFIILIVIFQHEIRQFFELIALLGTRQIKKSPSPSSDVSEAISQSVAQFAHEKVGALIILPGKDNVDQFISGGTLCDALVSEDILASIFDPNSAGHDGGMVISQGRIVKFGCQLPLSTNFKEVGRHGTRHSAALGLSEHCDALCVVVSEEKGTISITQDGKLKTLQSAQELIPILNKFFKEKYGIAIPSLWNTLVSQNIRLKIVALACAIIIWLTFAYRAEIVTREFSVPLTFATLAENTLIEDYTPKEIRVTLSGRGNDLIKNINPDDLVINLDTSGMKDGLNAISIPQTAIDHPLNTTIQSYSPNLVYLSVRKYQLIEIPIKVTTSGNPARNFSVDSISSTPTSVQVWVPDSTSPPTFIPTQPVNIQDATADLLAEVDLLLPDGVKLNQPDSTKVSVAVTVKSP